MKPKKKEEDGGRRGRGRETGHERIREEGKGRSIEGVVVMIRKEMKEKRIMELRQETLIPGRIRYEKKKEEGRMLNRSCEKE